jgi:hypothetical protein
LVMVTMANTADLPRSTRDTTERMLVGYERAVSLVVDRRCFPGRNRCAGVH